jgi:hypothetical protein
MINGRAGSDNAGGLECADQDNHRKERRPLRSLKMMKYVLKSVGSVVLSAISG